MTDLTWYGASDIGRRPENQDYFLARAEQGLFILCDGMGGHSGGAEAARRAAQSLAAELDRGTDLLAAVAAANQAVIAFGDELLARETGARRPGTTLVALRLGENQYESVWVGDSRAWLFSDDKLTPLTTDHSLVQELVNWGDISAAEALAHPRRHQLTQALGVVEPEALRPGRVSGRIPADAFFLLTSDGALCHENPAAAAALLWTTDNPRTIVEKLIAASLENGAQDNITVLAVASGAGGDAAAGTKQKNRFSGLLSSWLGKLGR